MNILSNEFNTQYDSIQKNFIKHTYESILEKRIDTLITKTKIEGFVTAEPVPFTEVQKYTLKEYKIGEKWGDLFDCGWFKITGQIPNFNKDLNYEFKLDLSGEALIVDKEGSPIKGFTNGSSAFDFNLGYPGKLYFDCNPLINDDGSFAFWVEAGANDLFGNLSEDGRVMISEIVIRDNEILKLYYDIETLYSALISLPKDADSYHKLFDLLLEVSYNVKYQNENWLNDSLDLIESFYISDKKPDFLITAVGHAHMDLAWLWPIRETRRKIGRFISNMFYLIEKYDDFIFGISQPQQIKWLKEDYPKLYEQFKKYVAANRIELQGAMWVEPDTNVPGEEALVRQMLYGQNFYMEEFGKKVNNLWLPDVFGYNGNMPQIIKKSGLDYFMTIKISWSLINEFPHHSFHWKGIDGSSVLTHMPPTGTYNSPASPRFLLDSKKKYKEKDIAPISMSLYGIGNGGGGPGIEHVERLLRANSIPDIPNIEFNTASSFFDKLNKYGDKLPTYEGELYLENHQGTYTSQSNIKKYNLMMEQKLKTFETLLVLTDNYSKYSLELDELWEETLLYQFHDILPGSSIKRVYDEALERYPIMIEELDSLIIEITKSNPNDLHRFNTLLTNVNKVFKEGGNYYRYDIKPHSVAEPIKTYSLVGKGSTNIETKGLKIQISDKTGMLTSVINKDTNKEVLTRPEGNKLLVYKDFGDGWNIDFHYRRQDPVQMVLTNQVVNDYSDIVEVINHYTFKNSKLIEVITIDKITDDIIFHHELDWHDVGYMLRTSFPIESDATDATFDIQFGYLNRSRLNDTTINKAQFEVSGQNWVNVKDLNHSISLLTKGKYGFYVKEDLLDINLLRSTDSPGKQGDIDVTTYSYQFLVGNSDMTYTEVDEKAMVLNSYLPYAESDFNVEPIIGIDNNNITYSAIKGGYNDEDIYVRLYNRSNADQTLNLTILKSGYNLYMTNLIEEEPTPISNEIKFSKFEIKTIKLKK